MFIKESDGAADMLTRSMKSSLVSVSFWRSIFKERIDQSQTVTIVRQIKQYEFHKDEKSHEGWHRRAHKKKGWDVRALKPTKHGQNVRATKSFPKRLILWIAPRSQLQLIRSISITLPHVWQAILSDEQQSVHSSTISPLNKKALLPRTKEVRSISI